MEMNNGNKTKRRRIIILSGDESIISQIQNSEQAALCKSVILQSEDEEIEIKNAKVNWSNLMNRKEKFYFRFARVELLRTKLKIIRWSVLFVMRLLSVSILTLFHAKVVNHFSVEMLSKIL